MQFNQRVASTANLAVAVAVAATLASALLLVLLIGAADPATITTFEPPKDHVAPAQSMSADTHQPSKVDLISKAVRDERERQVLESMERRGKEAAAAGKSPK